MTKNNLAGNGRLLSLDALRGFDMMFIMGLSGIIVSICALFPDGDTSWLAMRTYSTSYKHKDFHCEPLDLRKQEVSRAVRTQLLLQTPRYR